MAGKGGPVEEDPVLICELTPGEVPDEIQRNLRCIRCRMARAYKEKAQTLEAANPTARATVLEARPVDPTKLQVKHVVEYAEQAENALGRMLEDVTALRAQLAQAHIDQAARY